jgi:hypothetical protein
MIQGQDATALLRPGGGSVSPSRESRQSLVLGDLKHHSQAAFPNGMAIATAEEGPEIAGSVPFNSRIPQELHPVQY